MKPEDKALADERIRRAEVEVIQWAVAVAKRPNPDHAAQDAHLRRAVEEYEAAIEARTEACDHPNARPVSSPLPDTTEMYCEDCDTYWLEGDG